MKKSTPNLHKKIQKEGFKFMKGKKILAGILSAAMVFGTMAFPVFADDSTAIVTTTEELKTALANSTVTEITINGTIDTQGVDFSTVDGITIKGDLSDGADILKFSGTYRTISITFSDVTLEWPNANYQGLQHSTKLTYNNCTIKGQPFLYAKDEIFNNCTFIQESSYAYNVWTYGAENVEFNNCTFKSAGKSVLVYNEGTLVSGSISVKDCAFNANASVDGKAAIEIDSQYSDYKIDIDDKTTATGFGTGSTSGSSLYNVKEYQVVTGADNSKKLNTEIKVNGETVIPLSDEKQAEEFGSCVAQIGDKYFATLADAVAAAKAKDTITLIDNITTAEHIVFDNNVTIDLNGHTLTSDYALTGLGRDRYAIVLNNGGKITDSAADGEKGALIVNKARAIGSYNAPLNVEGATVKVTSGMASGNAVIGTEGGLVMKNSAVIGEFKGSYAVSSFSSAGKEVFEIEDSVIHGTSVGIYRNGSGTGEFSMTVKNSEITADSLAVYISNNNTQHDTKHNVEFENCTISGESGIEAKYTDITLTDCNVTATGTPSYSQNNNGAAADGFAVVITDNAVNDTKAKPEGTVIINGGNYSGLIGLENCEAANGYLNDGTKTTVKISGGSFTTDVSAYCADGFAAKKIGDVWVVDESASKVSLGFVKTADERVYDIVVKAEDAEKINRLNTADLTFNLTASDAANSSVVYTILPVDNITVTPDMENVNRYMFNFNGKDGVEDTKEEITIGKVQFDGYTTNGATITFAADDRNSLVTATTKSNNLVTYFGNGAFANSTAADRKIDGVKFAVPTKKLKVNIAMNNKVEDKAIAYQDMKVEIKGANTAKTIDLGNGGVVQENGVYTVTADLEQNIPYTVTVSGAGYRTARYTVNLNTDKTLNFWNNVMDEAKVVEVNNEAYKKNVTFLAGDIVKDNKINIYDLSAVVSYFGTDNLVAEHPEYAKYDLNRDGVIDSKDVAYVLVSWGN